MSASRYFALFGIIGLLSGCKAKPTLSVTPSLRSAGATSVSSPPSDGPAGDQKTLRPRLKARRLVVGQSLNCVILEDRTVACWGGDSAANCWNGSGSSTPKLVAGLTDIVDIAIAQGVVAVRSDGSVLLAADGIASPHKLQALTGVTRVSGDADALCAIATEGRVICYPGAPYAWDADTEIVGTEVRGVRGATELGFNHNYSCARVAGGEVKCWKMNALESAFRKRKAEDPPRQNTPLLAFALRGVKDATSLTVGTSILCVRHSDASAVCSDLNSSSKLGHDLGQVDALAMDQRRNYTGDNGIPWVCTARGKRIECQPLEGIGKRSSTQFPKAGPVPASELGHIVELGVKGATACARDEDGLVACWGRNTDGVLARPDLDYVEQPTRVPDVPEAKEVALGNRFSCALADTGQVWCWGTMVQDSSRRAEPHIARVPGLERIQHIFAAQDYCCAETENREIHCFLGPSLPDRERRPARIPAFEGARSVALPDASTIGWAAVANHEGELFLGTAPDLQHTIEGLSLAPIRGVVLDDAGQVYVGHIYGAQLSGKLERIRSPDGGIDVAYGTVLFAGGKIRAFSPTGPEESAVVREQSPLVSLLEGPSICGRTARGNATCFQGDREQVLFEGMKSSAGNKCGHVCGVDAQGLVYCRGHNEVGQCGVRLGIAASEIPLTVPLFANSAKYRAVD